MKDKATILVVDDNPANLQMVSGILAEAGYELVIAMSGQEALNYLEEGDADLVLLDVMMPEMDGYETCRQLKKSPKSCEIPIIFLTANNDIDQVALGFELGAVDYVTKPFHSTELLARINTHIELSKTRQALQLANIQLKKNLELLEVAATTDPLTQLLNRRAISNLIKDEVVRVKRNDKPFSILIADIDDFKIINDKYGHDGGDCLLKTVAELLQSVVREQDCVARWGGEEFLFFLPETRLEGAGILAEKLRSELLKAKLSYEDHPLQITMTIGASEYNSLLGFEETIKLADQALYQGKRSGKNRVVTA